MAVSLLRRDFDQVSSNSFRSLYNDLDLSDVTLVCSDKKLIYVHKVVVASASRMFQNLLAQLRQPNHLLYMQQDSVILQEIIRFIYLGKCVVSQSDFVKTYELLQMFQIEGGLTTEENDGHGQEELGENVTTVKIAPNDEKLSLNGHDLEQVEEQNEDKLLLNEHDL